MNQVDYDKAVALARLDMLGYVQNRMRWMSRQRVEDLVAWARDILRQYGSLYPDHQASLGSQTDAAVHSANPTPPASSTA